MTNGNYKSILRSSSIMGLAQGASILSNLLKMKIIAVLVGPFGVGLAGLYLSLMQTASIIGTLGLDSAGAKKIAESQGESGLIEVSKIGQTLRWVIIPLAVSSGICFWMASDLIASRALDRNGNSGHVAWLALGVALTVATASQTAVLTGLRKIGYLAMLRAASGISAAILGVIAVFLFGINGIIFLVLVIPIVTWLLGLVFVARLKIGTPERRSPISMLREIKAIVVLGFAIMVSAIGAAAGHLVVRILVQDSAGPEALGHFQASWTLSVTYVGFILGALGTDYFPRVTAIISQPEELKKLVNEQTEIVLLLSSPLMFATIGLAPWIIPLLYSNDFGPSVELLRLQILGDVLKVMSWPLAFVLLAAGLGKTFAFAELAGMGLLVLGTAIGLPLLGLPAVGISFLAMYLFYFPFVAGICAFRFGVRWNFKLCLLASFTIIGAIIIFCTSQYSDILGAISGIFFSVAFGVLSVIRIARLFVEDIKLDHTRRLKDTVSAWIRK